MTRGLLFAAVVGASLGCAGGRSTPAAPPPPPSPSGWETTLDSVRSLVAVERYADADSALARFAVRHAGTPQGAEAGYWRAVLALDPANESSSPRDALVAIDGYLAGGISQPRYAEALILRRTAGALESALATPPPSDSITTLPPDSLPRLRAAQDTIRQLRSELEKTQNELERIKRRIRP